MDALKKHILLKIIIKIRKDFRMKIEMSGHE